MPEIGINGEATLLSVRRTVNNTTNLALNEKGQVDRPVITTFKRFAPVVYDYQFSDGSIIGATSEHPFFSVDRNNYIAVGELQLGEQVMTAGQKVVKFVAGKVRDKGESVYNFEVWREHNYYVSGKDGGEWLLVHNSYLLNLLNGVKGAKGLIGEAYEVWLRKLFPNAKKVAPKELGPWQQREYGIFTEIGDKKILGEAKSGNALNLGNWPDVRSSLKQQNDDAIANGFEFYLFSNTKVPDHARQWLISKGIPIVETLD